MKIAQNTQARIRRMQSMNKKVDLSDADLILTNHTNSATKNQFQKLYNKIENVLKVFKMKNFQLLEGDSREYYHSALLRYTQILEIYTQAEEDLLSNKESDLKQAVLMKNKKNVSFSPIIYFNSIS